MFTTGASDSFAQNNIYDLAGNVAEITLQQAVNGTAGIVIRGGLAAYEGTANRANSHYLVNSTEYETARVLVGYRTMLIKDEGYGPESAATAPSYIPEGYTHVEGTTMSNGYVVKDSSGNEFVWVEVPRTSTVYPTAGVNITEFTEANYTKIENDLKTYTSSYRTSGYSDTHYSGNGFSNETEYNKQKRKMLRSIYKNEGFYIGRYETGTTSIRTSTSSPLTTPLIKPDIAPYTYVTVTQAQNLSTQFASSG